MKNGIPEPMFYVLMRTDMASMNPGKAVAQGTHAAHQFVFDLSHLNPNDEDTPVLHGLFDQWAAGTGHGFGTAITLEVNEKQMRELDAIARDIDRPIMFGVIHDPTYPLRDGEVTHLIPVDTCAYAFAERDDLRFILKHLDLMP